MKVFENIIKLSDFPFSYSLITGIVSLGIGKTVTLDNLFSLSYYPLLLLIGFFGTALALIDPGGIILRWYGGRSYTSKFDLFGVRRKRNLNRLLNDIKSSIANLEDYATDLDRVYKLDLQEFNGFINKLEKSINEPDFNFNSRDSIFFADDTKSKIGVYRSDFDRISGHLQEPFNSQTNPRGRKWDIPPARMQEMNPYISDLYSKMTEVDRTYIGLNFEDPNNPVRKKALVSSIINYEVDKIVSAAYFIVILLLFTIALFWNNSPIVSGIDNFLQTYIQDERQSSQLAREYAFTIGIASVILLVLMILTTYKFSIKKLPSKIRTVSVYLYAIGYGPEKQLTKDYAEKLNNSFSIRDWGTAERLAELLENSLYE